MRYTFLASFAVTVLATTAFAQGGGMGMMRADTNGDGMISRAEATAQANARFDRMDANKDGTLTADERQGPGGRMMARAGGGDGAMTRADFMARADRRFALIDTNKDGQLSADERKVWEDKARAIAGQRRADPADAIAPPAAPAPAPNPGQ
ncbi:EF-hand domain-containing protein [Sphingomonas sp.]|uniref:EF-hand domain-containing protein n=1 Tax=Sphingomonas sp. TaxID=28214 RepID=UPI0033414F31